MNRRQILQEVEELMTSYCKGCFLHKLHKDEKGRRYAHRFCINKCTVGEKIKNYGEKLT
ncbi:zinc-finger domain-containing protein [Cytobacillus sp. FJAT-54145]|uniref:Zinc-finger domain-containing protein n=1 Tax=Cytobacillus spartinae TaxID=3299023 RepID=A0ABW6KH18_9BACI